MSRPARRILIVDPNEFRRSVRACLLTVWGFSVTDISPREAKSAALLSGVDVAILEDCPRHFCEAIRRQSPDTNTLVLALRAPSYATTLWLAKDTSAAVLVDRVKALAMRKKGPKAPRPFSEVTA